MEHLPQRKSPRLQGYDYAQSGAYFVTICTHQRQNIFGDIINGTMVLSDLGQIASLRWESIPQHYPDLELDAFVIMPNHIHGIVCIMDGKFHTVLGRVINAYKGAVTAQIRQQSASDMVIWQSRYHDHIIRNEIDLNRIREYISHNPSKWEEDSLYT